MSKLEARIWDVGHGLSVWIKTPNGKNHWVDAGYNPDGDFSPSRHVARTYSGASPIHLLTISHPDKDHFDDLDRMIETLGKPKYFLRNRTLPDEIKFDSGLFAYQKAFKDLDSTYNGSVDWSLSPINPVCNGGINIVYGQLSWTEAEDVNNSSIVMFYQFADTLIVFPGDIESEGWEALYPSISQPIKSILERSKFRILVAPHHGRGNGYSQEMFDALKPHMTIISDDYGRAPTDRRFRENSIGIRFNGETRKYISTKSNTRALIVVGPNGLETVTDS